MNTAIALSWILPYAHAHHQHLLRHSDSDVLARPSAAVLSCALCRFPSAHPGQPAPHGGTLGPRMGPAPPNRAYGKLVVMRTPSPTREDRSASLTAALVPPIVCQQG